MTAASIILGIALFIAIATYLAYPFWRSQPATPRVRRSQLDLLNEQKEAILAQIRVLDFDFETGKIPAAAHAAQRAQLLAEATAVLQEIDALAVAAPRKTAPPADLEAAIARARKTPTPINAPATDLDSAIEAAIARARRKETAVSSPAPTVSNGRPPRFCPQCGQSVQPGDKFCNACGQPLLVKAAK